MCITQTNEQVTKLYESFRKMKEENKDKRKKNDLSKRKDGGDKQTS